MKDFKIDFLGIGAVKSGTTWLADCLRDHPEIYLPKQKEVFFFDYSKEQSNYARGLKWYQKFFKNAPKDTIKGEFSTAYMFSPDSSRLIHKHFPNIKLIVCLRRPDKMLYSFYWWKKANYNSRKLADSFREHIERNPQVLQRGNYYTQLKRYYDLFPKKNIKIFLMKDIKKDSVRVLKEVYSFLEVDEDYRPAVLDKKVNSAKKVKHKFLANSLSYGRSLLSGMGLNRLLRDLESSRTLSDIYSSLNKQPFEYPPMTAATQEYLINYYRPEIEKLEELLDRSLDPWLER